MHTIAVNIYLFFFALQLAVIAFIYSVVFVEPGMILNRWYKFLNRHLGRYPFLFKPLIDCDRCVGGQFAFWTMLIEKHFYRYGITMHDVITHIYFITLTVLIVTSLQKLHRWLTN